MNKNAVPLQTRICMPGRRKSFCFHSESMPEKCSYSRVVLRSELLLRELLGRDCGGRGVFVILVGGSGFKCKYYAAYSRNYNPIAA